MSSDTIDPQIDLLPCPFCGKQPKLLPLFDIPNVVIECVNTNCYMTARRCGMAAVEQWNTRYKRAK